MKWKQFPPHYFFYSFFYTVSNFSLLKQYEFEMCSSALIIESNEKFEAPIIRKLLDELLPFLYECIRLNDGGMKNAIGKIKGKVEAFCCNFFSFKKDRVGGEVKNEIFENGKILVLGLWLGYLDDNFFLNFENKSILDDASSAQQKKMLLYS